MNTPTLTGAYTCTHHNDAMRAACPVCFVATLTAERDRLRAEVEKVYALVTPVGFDLPGGIFETAQAVIELRAERDQLRAEVERLSALGSWAHTCIHHTDEERKAWVACPCCAIARAMKAEADLVALEQCHDDNCRGVVRIAADLATERARLDYLLKWDVTFNSRKDIDRDMQEAAK